VIEALLSRYDRSELNNCLLARFQKYQLAMLTKNGFTEEQGLVFKMVSPYNFKRESSLLKDLQDVADELWDLTIEQKTKWDGFIYSLQAQGLVQNDKLRNLVFTTRDNPSQSASSGSAGVAAEPQAIATGSSSGTRGGEYPSSAPQPRRTGDVARGAEAASSSSESRFAPPPRGTGAASSSGSRY
jgi:hypothetical protein